MLHQINIEDIIALISELQELHGDQNKAINDGTPEFYSAITLVRNILELIDRYNQENPDIKLPRSDRLRNKLTHCPFMINSEELMNFIDSKLNNDFIKNIRSGNNVGNNFFEDSGLYKALEGYRTDPKDILQDMQINKFNYAFHCIDYLEKFIKYNNEEIPDSVKAVHSLATQFSLEQFLIILKLLKQVIPELTSRIKDKKIRLILDDQFFNNYIKQLRNSSAHGGVLTPARLLELVPSMEKLLLYLKEYFKDSTLECFNKPASKSCPRLEKISKGHKDGLGRTIQAIDERIAKQQLKARQEELLQKIAEKKAFFAAREKAKKQKTYEQQAIDESLKDAEKKDKIGLRTINGWGLKNVEAEGNCFYLAIADQLQLINHPLTNEVPNGTDLHDWLRLQIQGAGFKDKEWAQDQTIDQFVARFPNIALAIVDTRNSQAGFVCYYHNGIMIVTNTGDDPDLAIPSDKKIIKIAATGNHYLSVRFHPILETGAIHEAWNIETTQQAIEVNSNRRGLKN